MEMTEIVDQGKVRLPNQSSSNSNRCADDDKTIQKVVHKLRRLFDNVIIGDKVTPRSAIIETDYEQSSGSDKTEHLVPNMNNFGSFDDLFEDRLCNSITEQLERLLVAHGNNDLNCQLLVPSDFSSRIAQDVLRMSQNEPCGIRGCVLFINMQEKSVCRKIGRIECDPSTVATFELYLTLREDTRPWVIAKNVLASVRGRMNGSSNSTKVLCPGYQLAKRKLYRPN
ncbi:DNA damage-inducible transcript 4-like protein [Liolophura sinensis]|uniref:DNA damage-inducible transcript 4-like protein n=1 Tax=Liolophura sinensis TaxID=3198878 RepID=UPI003158B8B7